MQFLPFEGSLFPLVIVSFAEQVFKYPVILPSTSKVVA